MALIKCYGRWIKIPGKIQLREPMPDGPIPQNVWNLLRPDPEAEAGAQAQHAKHHRSPKSCAPSQPSKQTAPLLLLRSHPHSPKSTTPHVSPASSQVPFHLRVDFKSASGQGQREARSPPPPAAPDPPRSAPAAARGTADHGGHRGAVRALRVDAPGGVAPRRRRPLRRRRAASPHHLPQRRRPWQRRK